MSSDNGIEPGFIDELLALQAREQQIDLLRTAGLLDADGLDRLLDIAERLARDEPSEAHRLAGLCADLAEMLGVPAAVPRTLYIRVQTHFASGDFDAALSMISAAHDGYETLGMNLQALRTNIGKMAVFLETGRYREALEVGRAVLETLDDPDKYGIDPSDQEGDLLTAFVQNNRGGCLEYMGRYEEALEAYAVAEQRFRDLGMIERVGEVSMNRGAVLLYLGQGNKGLAAQEAAASVFSKAGLTLMHTKALVNIGEAHLYLGNYRRSLRAFEQARHSLELSGDLSDSYLLLRHTADAYLELNLFSEALATYRETENLLRGAGMPHDRAQALWGMGSALVAHRRLEEASQVLKEAADLFAIAGNTPRLSSVMLEQASLLETEGKKQDAVEVANRALNLVSGNEWPVQTIYAHLRVVDLLLPDVIRAEPHLREARQIADRVSLPQLHYRLDERTGNLRRLQGRDEEARVLLEAAVGQIERLRGTVAQDAMRASFLRDKAAAYEGLLQVHLVRNNEEGVRHAFVVAEHAKSRALVDMLTGVAQTARDKPTNHVQETRLWDMQADLNAVYSELLGGPGEVEREMLLPDLQARAIELEQEISRMRLQIAASEVATDLFADAQPGDISDRLSSDLLLVAYHVVGDEIMAFVVERGTIRVSRRLGKTAEIQKLLAKLTSQWDRFQAGREFAGKHMTMLERSARQVLLRLYGQLVAPLESILDDSGAQKLVVVPHGLLHQVPFHALFDGQRYLIERFEISYAPSALVYTLCQERASNHSEKTLVFGVSDPTIPAATAEAYAVADFLPGAETHVGEAATVEALNSGTPGCSTLHLACHGLFRSDNPMFSALKLYDGWLMAADAIDLDLHGALVTLSACESGRSEVYGGDETIGLTRAFLGAGAATLAVSLWLVQDETTAELMGEWYARLRGGQGRAAALRTAQLEIKRRHPHPYYWAPFVLIGKR